MRSARREFDRKTKEEGWLRCHERCEECDQPFGGRRPEFHHVIAASLGGANTLDNMQVLCPPCHRLKTSKEDIPRISKSKRIEAKRAGIKSKHQWFGRRRSG